MCGIVGYCGPRRVVPVVLEGLRRLEYRGYDSAGIVYLEEGKLVKHRSEGKLARLEAIIGDALITPSHIGLGHTRWATHGAPTTRNAHPHSDCTGDLVVIHNGIIENYHSLREDLKQKGHIFSSETDTEVLAHLIEDNLDGDLVVAVKKAISLVEGSYAIGVLWAGMPDTLIAVRNQSPLVLGVSEKDGNFLASDIPALLPYTNQVIFMDDMEMAILKADSHQIFSLITGKQIAKRDKNHQLECSYGRKGRLQAFHAERDFRAAPGYHEYSKRPNKFRDRGGGSFRDQTVAGRCGPDRSNFSGCLRDFLACRPCCQILDREICQYHRGSGYRLGISIPSPADQ